MVRRGLPPDRTFHDNASCGSGPVKPSTALSLVSRNVRFDRRGFVSSLSWFEYSAKTRLSKCLSREHREGNFDEVVRLCRDAISNPGATFPDRAV